MEIIRRVNKLLNRPVISTVRDDDFDVKRTYKERTKGMEGTMEKFDYHFKETRYSFVITFIRVFWFRWIVRFALKAINTVFDVILPILIFRLFTIFNEEERSNKKLLVVVSIVILINLVKAFFQEMNWTDLNKWQNEFKMCFSYTLYKKSLRTFDCETSKEKLINLCENDLWKFANVLNITIRLPNELIQMTATFAWMTYILGFSSFLTIVAMFLILVPINYFGFKYAYQQEQTINDNSDKRIKTITEVIKTIRFIKSYVWEDVYEEKIKAVRKVETNARKKSCVGWSFVELAWIMSQFVLSSCSWIIYVYLGNSFSASVCFTIVTLSNRMAPQVFSLSNSLNEIMKARLAAKRVVEFMNLEEIGKEDNSLIMFDDDSEEKVVALKYENCSFCWKERKKVEKKEEGIIITNLEVEDDKKEEEDKTNTTVLHNINLKILEGEFVGITGPIGSGKTALINSILGEMKKIDEDECRIYVKNGTVSLFSQTHWVRSATIKDNILFCSEYKKERYDAVIHACALEEDLKEFVDGDETMVGENGVTLSGGQKARVALARMAYVEDNVSLYVADDPLKDLDESVAKHVMHHVFGKILGGKTRVLVTHHVESLRYASRVLIMDKGRIVKDGPPLDVLAGKLVTPTPTSSMTGKMGFPGFEAEEEEEVEGEYEEIKLEENNNDQKKKKTTTTKKKKEEKVVIRDNFDWKLLISYLLESRLVMCIFFILLLAKFVFENLRDLGLGQWSSDTTFSSHSIFTYILRDMCLGIATGIIVIVSMILFQNYQLILSEKAHNKMLKKVLQAPSKWFDMTLSGEILSRFGKDINTLDNDMRWRLREFIFCGFYMISTFCFVMYCCPSYILVVVPLCLFIFLKIRRYVSIFIKVTRLESKENSPMITHMNETNEGLAIIRAFGKEKMFCEEMLGKIKRKIKLNFLENDLCFWMATRTRWSINISILFFCILCLVMKIDGVYASMALSRLFDAQFLVTWVLYLIPSIQKCLASLERVVDYVNKLPSEEKSTEKKEGLEEVELLEIKIEDEDPAPMVKGEIEFKNVMFMYDTEEEEYVLNDISFRIEPGQTLGIVGRTGSGKSTIVKILFSLYEEESGDVLVHGRRRKDWKSLKELRNSMVYIAQNPTLLQGTLRQNLDLDGETPDSELWMVLQEVGLDKTLRDGLGLSLDSSIESVKLSAGEKQLLCFGRALIKKKKNRMSILVLDEATSACDLETDRKIQRIVKRCFKDSTIIAIAHRIETIIQFDRIIAIQGGKIVENGKPKRLLEKGEEGLFFEICKKTGRKRIM